MKFRRINLMVDLLAAATVTCCLSIPSRSIYVASGDLVFTAYPDEVTRFWEMSWK